MTVILTKVDGQELITVSSYLDINNDDVITSELQEVITYATTKKWGLLIGMDSNCHSVLYGLETNQRGEKLEKFVAETGLVVENVGKDPTYESRGNSTRIDITLSKNMRVDIINWKVDREYNASDHNTITYELGREQIQLHKSWKWHKADWQAFSEKLMTYKSTLPSNIKDKDCEKELKHMYDCIRGAMKKAIPKSKATVVDKNYPWWNNKLKQQRALVSKLYKKQLNAPSEANVNRYKVKHREYKNMCEKARKESWRKLQQSINSIQDMNTFHKVVEANNKLTLGTLVREDGSYTDPGKETIANLLSKHFPDSQPLKPTIYSGTTVLREHIKKWDPDWITKEKLSEILKGFKSKKSPGTDELSPLVLKNFPPEFLTHLVFLYKCLIKLNFTPTKWKESKMVFIPKAGKETYKVFKS